MKPGRVVRTTRSYGTQTENVSQNFSETQAVNASQSRYEAHFLLCESFLEGRGKKSYG